MLIKGYKDYLISEEKSSSTILKYIHDITRFVKWLEGREIYTLESGEIHRNRIQNLGLILDLTLQNTT